MYQGGIYLDKAYLRESGFKPTGENQYFRKTGNIYAVLKTDNNMYSLTGYCSPTFDGIDSEADVFIRDRTQELGFTPGSYYVSGRVVLTMASVDEGSLSELLPKALEFLDEVIEKFDMLPSCANCCRRSELSLFVMKGNTMPVCDVCKGQLELKIKQDEIIRNSVDPNRLDIRHPIFDRGPLLRAVFIGIQGGILGSAIALTMVFLGAIIIFFRLMPWVPGAAAGFYTMKGLLKIDYCSHRLRTIIGLLASIITLFIFSIINILVLGSLFSNTFPFGTYFLGGNVGIIQIAVGLGGFFLSAAIAYFIDIHS